MKYALLASLFAAIFSFTKCLPFLAQSEPVGLVMSLYCRVTFLHFIPRSFSPIDLIIHVFFWGVVGVLLWRLYRRYFGGKI